MLYYVICNKLIDSEKQKLFLNRKFFAFLALHCVDLVRKMGGRISMRTDEIEETVDENDLNECKSKWQDELLRRTNGYENPLVRQSNYEHNVRACEHLKERCSEIRDSETALQEKKVSIWKFWMKQKEDQER